QAGELTAYVDTGGTRTFPTGPGVLLGRHPSVRPVEVDPGSPVVRASMVSEAKTRRAFAVPGPRPIDLDFKSLVEGAPLARVAVMIELVREESEKLLSLSETLEIKNEFKSVVDGSPYSMSMGDDSDATVYQNVGKTMTLEELNRQMITVSSNFATNLLIDRLG